MRPPHASRGPILLSTLLSIFLCHTPFPPGTEPGPRGRCRDIWEMIISKIVSHLSARAASGPPLGRVSVLRKQPGHTWNGHCAVVALGPQAISSRLPPAAKGKNLLPSLRTSGGPTLPEATRPQSADSLGCKSPGAGTRPHSFASVCAASEQRVRATPQRGEVVAQPCEPDFVAFHAT